MKHRYSTLTLALLAVVFGCRQEQPETIGEKEITIRGQVLAADGAPVQGVIAIESGRLYSKDYRFGAPVGADGNFSIPLPREGDYGLHVYATGYIYHPVGIRVEEDRTEPFTFHLPPNPAQEDSPSISNVRFAPEEGAPPRVKISLKVTDPNDNLSHQVLGVNVRTGESRLFSPPGLVLPWVRDYPGGTYTLEYETGGQAFEPKDWRFLAADNRCYNSPVLQWPFTREGIVPARAEGVSAPSAVDQTETERTPVEAGGEIFAANCAVCHHSDRSEAKIGPGLKDLFERELTPVEKVPVTEAGIRERIRHGGDKMPPYSHIEGEDLDHLIAYLQSL